MTKLLAFGDLHLGAGADYGARPGDRLRDQDAALAQIATLALAENVDGVLCAGDTFNGPGITPEQLDVFARFVARLRAARIPMLAICGNGVHDLSMRETNGLAIFDHIDGIDVHSQPSVVDFAGAQVALLPWVSSSRLIAQFGADVARDEVNATVAELVVDVARDLYARMDSDRPRILLGHWSVSGAALPNGLPVADLREPVLSLPDLEEIGFDACVFGHIHFGGLINPEWPVFYVGSPMPLNHGEGHYEHGVWLIKSEGGEWTSTEFSPLASRPFVTVGYDAVHGALDGPDDLSGAIVRVRYTATREQARQVDVNEIRAALSSAGAARVTFQADIVREQRARVEGLDAQLDSLGALDLYLGSQEWDADRRLRVRRAAAEILETAA